MNPLSVFSHNEACNYCRSVSGKAPCSHQCLEHLAQIRATLKLVQGDIKGSRSWLGDLRSHLQRCGET